MAVPVLEAAKTICEIRDWSVSNLSLQKILYLAQMYHLGVNAGVPLINEEFEAWDYGPVVPELYHHVKGFGSGPIRNVFHWINPVPRGNKEFAILEEVANSTKGMSAAQLVASTHWPGGAWAQSYRPNIFGIRIPNYAIFNEYRARVPVPA